MRTGVYNPQPKLIRYDDAVVTVKMMDEGWIINRCVSHSPFVSQPGIVWSHEDRCTRLRIPGDRFEDAMRNFREKYGNAAVIAWDKDVVLGHMIFIPKAEAVRWKMLYYERMPSPDDSNVLVVKAVGFCSIGGQEYRKRGIGRAMAEMMIDWAEGNGWSKIQIFGVPSGLLPLHWMDSCMPPKPFWEKFGFEVIGKTGIHQTWNELKTEILDDDPRASRYEAELKKEIIDKVERGIYCEEDWAYDFDMEKVFSA